MTLKEELASAGSYDESVAIASRYVEEREKQHEKYIDQTVEMCGHGLITMRDALAIDADQI